jgi:hypothetical protein
MQPLTHPNKWDLSVDWEQIGLLDVDSIHYKFKPTVKDFTMMIKAKETEDDTMLNYILAKHGIFFNNNDEMETFFVYLFDDFISSRFGVSGTSSSTKKVEVFDFLVDSDIIYSNMCQAYPQLIKSPKDLQDMDYWHFKLLFDNLNNTLSDRIELRSKTPEKGKNVAKQNAQLRKAQASVKINKTKFLKNLRVKIK